MFQSERLNGEFGMVVTEKFNMNFVYYNQFNNLSNCVERR